MENLVRNPNSNGLLRSADLANVFAALRANAPKHIDAPANNTEYNTANEIKPISPEKFAKILEKEGVSKRYILKKQAGEIDYDVGLLKYHSEAMKSIADGKVIMLLGEVGRGKSFLAYDCIYEFKKPNPMDIRTFCSRASLIVSDYKANYSNLEYIIKKIFNPSSYWYKEGDVDTQLVVIDELHNLKPTDYDVISEIVIHAYETLTPLFLIGNYSQKHLKESLAENAISRILENCIAFKVDGEDLRVAGLR